YPSSSGERPRDPDSDDCHAEASKPPPRAAERSPKSTLLRTTSELQTDASAPRGPHHRTSGDDFRASRPSHLGAGNLGSTGLKTPDGEGVKIRLQAGKMVPGTRYKIIRWLGEGGMGVVYLAEHADIGRQVALKILRFDLSHQPRATRVFRDEARTASKIGSRYIVDIFDFGELPDGRLFFCMEVVEGSDLVLTDAQSRMELPRLIPIIRQVCKGLHAAHQADIVHRDIKPENILVTSLEGRPDAVKILDFGISAMLSAGSQQEGSIAGTPLYMAPEQATGVAFDRRLDIYAVGCLLYELVAGRPPFVTHELVELLRQQCEDPPPPFAEVVPDRHTPLPLQQVVFKCLEKNPADRFRDMADLEAAICELQIELDIVTAWDDLPVPDGIGDERRAAILAGMPNPLDLQGPTKKNP
ncbi:MAG: serine/threonine-protein kinase, partial [Nannocystaceae bacterium]